MSIHGRLVDASGGEHPFDAETMNVSLEGIAILYHDAQEKMQIVQSVLSENQQVELELALPRQGEKMKATGTIKWYKTGATDPSFHYLIAGIFLQQLEPKQKLQWERFIEDRARITREALKL